MTGINSVEQAQWDRQKRNWGTVEEETAGAQNQPDSDFLEEPRPTGPVERDQDSNSVDFERVIQWKIDLNW